MTAFTRLRALLLPYLVLLAGIAAPGAASGSAPAPSAAGLDGFRAALERLQHRLEEATRLALRFHDQGHDGAARSP